MKNKLYLSEEQPVRYKKKSKARGLPRADHKHLYETVLLTKRYNGTDFKTGRPTVSESTWPTRVCTVCGRIDCLDRDPKYYNRIPLLDLPFKAYEDELSDLALALPRWVAADFWDKFARKIE